MTFAARVLFFVVLLPGAALAATVSRPAGDDFVAIERYAQLANAAYENAAAIRPTVTALGYRLDRVGSIPGVEVSYFLATDAASKTQVIAVRGTANVENALVDVALQLTADSHAGVRLHGGFAQAAAGVYGEIKLLLRKDYRISTTGHSLGGAVALILAMYLDVDGYRLGPVVTFGQPKVTNIAGAQKFRHLQLTRVVTPHDLVPLVPPFDPVDVNNLDIYWHLGTELVLLPGKDYALLEGLDSMLRASGFFARRPDQENLQHHQMALYLSLLRQKLGGATRVPYQNKLNLFNLLGGS
jgi:triacylglycerol lipase